jgi:hypothetical protein
MALRGACTQPRPDQRAAAEGLPPCLPLPPPAAASRATTGAGARARRTTAMSTRAACSTATAGAPAPTASASASAAGGAGTAAGAGRMPGQAPGAPAGCSSPPGTTCGSTSTSCRPGLRIGHTWSTWRSTSEGGGGREGPLGGRLARRLGGWAAGLLLRLCWTKGRAGKGQAAPQPSPRGLQAACQLPLPPPTPPTPQVPMLDLCPPPPPRPLRRTHLWFLRQLSSNWTVRTENPWWASASLPGKGGGGKVAARAYAHPLSANERVKCHKSHLWLGPALPTPFPAVLNPCCLDLHGAPRKGL